MLTRDTVLEAIELVVAVVGVVVGLWLSLLDLDDEDDSLVVFVEPLILLPVVVVVVVGVGRADDVADELGGW